MSDEESALEAVAAVIDCLTARMMPQEALDFERALTAKYGGPPTEDGVVCPDCSARLQYCPCCGAAISEEATDRDVALGRSDDAPRQAGNGLTDIGRAWTKPCETCGHTNGNSNTETESPGCDCSCHIPF